VQSSLISKIQKARQYAQEPERIRITTLKLEFRGDNGDHVVEYTDGRWKCSCHFFAGWGFCCHTMAMERILGVMLPTRGTYDQLFSSVGEQAAGRLAN